MKKSFFGKYFLYKLKNFCGVAVAAATMNFAALVLPVLFYYGAMSKAYMLLQSYGYEYLYFKEIPVFIPLCAVAAATVMLTITSALSFKYYNNRAAMDTLGCLPLNYRERFCGDFLGGLTANLISFIPFAAVGTVIVAIMQNTVVKDMQAALWENLELEYIFSDIKDNFLKAYAGFVLLLLLGYIGTYVISTFVTSCCGRVGSSIFYSVIALVVPAGIVSTFGTCVLNGAVGIIVDEEIGNLLMPIAPAGMWLGTGMKSITEYSYIATLAYIVDNPVHIVKAFLIIAAFFVGAYFLGKHRKAERVDRDFVYSGAYHVIALALSATIIGFYFVVSPENSAAFKSGDAQKIVTSIALGLIIYVVMELVHTRNAKRLPMSLLRYSVLYTVCIGFLFIADMTDGFGISEKLPDKSNISSVEVEGSLFYSPDGVPFVYRSEAAVDTILSGHENLIQNRGSLKTGETVSISYRLNNGSELRRQYSSQDDMGRELLAAFSGEVKKNEVSEGGLGFIDDPRYDELVNISCEMHSNYTDGDWEMNYIRPEAGTELFEALKYDLLNNYEPLEPSNIITVTISYKLNGAAREATYSVKDNFEKTIAVIENNLVDGAPDVAEDDIWYYIHYKPGANAETPLISSLSLSLESSDESASAKAVTQYIAERKDTPKEERSEHWTIISDSQQYKEFCVRKTDERAMLKAVLNAVKEMIRSE